MHCLQCADKYGLPTEGEVRLSRCTCCGKQRACYTDKVVDRKLLLEPREAIRNHIRGLNKRIEEMQPIVDEYNQIYLERLRLREEYLRLEHLLTDVKVKVVKARYQAPQKKPDHRLKTIINAMTVEEKAKLIDILKGKDKQC